MDGQSPAPVKALNRFNTGHYADLCAHHADVVEALCNELDAAHAALAERTLQRDELAVQTASLKRQNIELEATVQKMRACASESAPVARKGGRK